MRKYLATFVMLLLFAPTIALSAESNVDLTQVNVELFKVQEQLNTLKAMIAVMNATIVAKFTEDTSSLAQHMTNESEPFKQSAPTILVIAMLISAFFIFKGMNLINRKMKADKQPRGV